MPRPDFSEYVVHFTTQRPPLSAGRDDAPEVIGEIAELGAFQRLQRILEQRTITATPMPYTGRPSVCFSECVWASLLEHAGHYSRYGIGFKKSFLFANGGAPAIYMRQDLYRAQVDEQHGFHDDVWPFITPFVPEYAGEEHLAEFWPNRPASDYSHEREWRVPHDLTFDLPDVALVIVAWGNDAQQIVESVGEDALRGKILLMDNYSRVTALWPWNE